jgi:YggT family protein
MLVALLYYALELLKWLIIARALISWFMSPYSSNPAARFVRRITDPILRPLSEVIPPLGGIDISPLVAFFAIQLTQAMIVRL